jgi:hypothetical protein
MSRRRRGPPIRLPHEVKSLWCSGSAEILTIQPAELVATVIAHCMGLAVGEGSESGGGESDLPCSRH